ncbi:hypothetical protein CN998_33270, partial [Bacillus cereus]
YKTAQSVLQSLRKSGAIEIAQTDFERLKSLGINNAETLNLGGLIHSALGQYPKALTLYEEAISKDPKRDIYKTNYGTIAYILNKIDPALSLLNTLTEKE